MSCKQAWKRGATVLVGVLALLLTRPLLAQVHGPAGAGHRLAEYPLQRPRERRSPIRPKQERPVRVLPHGAVRLRIGPQEYYALHGHFYRPEPSGFFPVTPLIGSVVVALPLGAVIIEIGGVRYYRAGGIYFRAVAGGYLLVPPPRPLPSSYVVSLQQVVVQVPALNVRAGPGRNYVIIGTVLQGDNLLVQGSAPGWYYVQLPGGLQSGWVESRYTAVVGVVPAG